MRTDDDALRSLQRHVARVLPDEWTIKVDLEQGAVPDRPYAVVTSVDDEALSGNASHVESMLPVVVYLYVEAETRREAREQALDARQRVTDLLTQGDAVGRPWLLPLFDYSGRNAVQRVAVTGATGGTYGLALQTPGRLARAAGIPYDADAMTLGEALDAVAPGLTRVTPAAPGLPLVVEMRGALAGAPVPAMVPDGSALTGDAPEVAVAVLAEGDPSPWRSPRDFARVTNLSGSSTPEPGDPKLRTASVSARLTWARAAQVPSATPTLRSVRRRVEPER